MVSDRSTLPALTQNCRVLIHFTDDSGASLETSLSPILAKMARSKTQGWSSGSSSRGGVATPGCKARSPVRGLEQAVQTTLPRSGLLLGYRRSMRTGTGRIIRHFTSAMQALETRLLGSSLVRKPLHALPRCWSTAEREREREREMRPPQLVWQEDLCNITCGIWVLGLQEEP